MTTLFTRIQLGDLRLPNRIFMAPLTRSRGTEDHLPQADLMAKYYRQRATAGLILSEALPVAPMAVGYARVPGIWSPAQVEAWKPVTDAVHSENGRIFAQLWHVGRISHSRFLQGRLPVAPSAIQPAGHLSLVRPITPFEIPRALSLGEVKQIPELFQLAARHAKEAGFDGVELHGANGYLLDQFLQSSTNQRSDEYGGSIENRARLILECTDAVIQVFGPGRVGMHLAPRRDINDMGDDNPEVTFGHVAEELGKRSIGLHYES
jgi:2,4-dienoyl-CoA reductase-like NADH-dependent reductase (Old Yellow Enzyme family)